MSKVTASNIGGGTERTFQLHCASLNEQTKHLYVPSTFIHSPHFSQGASLIITTSILLPPPPFLVKTEAISPVTYSQGARYPARYLTCQLPFVGTGALGQGGIHCCQTSPFLGAEEFPGMAVFIGPPARPVSQWGPLWLTSPTTYSA